ncbi:hypothetical protein BUALT_Bualt03G0087500 [Buddleja alternifolia]|uniref:RRM domain-containing protein n=1 Tax=Buddleja alternifolia TaxID=168488 RepID=A0AAV6Y3F0_9LAMI|nr:hypothetical protein BUALT_Bualt03G0087500 [Buddleja alternifolia]
MEMEPGKLFIGGISWDTSEERMREYFEAFGEVVEAVIMKDRTTGRARGFGFVVFANASVAEKVVREKHIIDGRTVEAKKAVPRDDHQNFNRNSTGSIQGSPGLARTKKIFVGGLASTVTESDFKRYFDQFGTITDVVVMYDHNTQRPRGFGFITYDSEEAVDKVLTKTFHELNGKMVEVKRAVPKELSPGPTRNQSAGYNYGLNRMSSLLNAYSQGYNSSPGAGGYGMRMDGRFSPVTVGRSGYPPYSPSNYNTGLNNLDSGIGLNYGASGDSGLGYGRGMNSYYNGNPSRYGSPIGYDMAGNGPLLNPSNRNLWGNENLNYGTNSVASNAFFGSGTGNAGIIGNFGTIREIWGSSPGQGGSSGTLSSGTIGYGNGEHNLGTRGGYGRNNNGSGVANNVGEGVFGSLYGGESFYGDHGWRSSTPELEGPTAFGYGRGSAADVTTPNDTIGYVGGYSVDARSNRGIAA